MRLWRTFFGRKKGRESEKGHERSTSEDVEEAAIRPKKWSYGVLNPKDTVEVPGSVRLLSNVEKRNEPLGLRLAPARRSSSSFPSPYPPSYRAESPSSARKASRRRSSHGSVNPDLKKTPDGKFVLDPQPDDSHNDPLNWPLWRRNAALLSLGYYCMLGGGTTPLLAAGFNNVASTYDVTVPQVALTTGLYMMGMGVGCVIMSPTAILWGKRPVYLATAIMFIASSVWCALSPNYISLLIARIFQGIAVSPVECLPSATIAEIFFLHERAYRIGIYTLLLLGGKNLVPLVSAVIINTLGWRWVFWVLAMAVGLGFALLFLFVGESFWDRTPVPKATHFHFADISEAIRKLSRKFSHIPPEQGLDGSADREKRPSLSRPGSRRTNTGGRVSFAQQETIQEIPASSREPWPSSAEETPHLSQDLSSGRTRDTRPSSHSSDGSGRFLSGDLTSSRFSAWKSPLDWDASEGTPDYNATVPDLRNLNSPWYEAKAEGGDYFAIQAQPHEAPPTVTSSAFHAPALPPPQISLTIPSPPTPSPVLKLPEKRRAGTEKHVTMSPEAVKLSEAHDNPEIADNLSPLAKGLSERRKTPAKHVIMPSDTRESVESDLEEVKASVPVSGQQSGLVSFEDTPEGHDPNRSAKSKYTDHYRTAPPKTYLQTLNVWSGRLTHDKWHLVAFRPFVLCLYPAILWSSVVYSLSIGWLIIMSESMSTIYKNPDRYNFTSLQTGLVYLSPFIGGILGTAVAGKVSDSMVRFMARRNDGIYEPEFRLVMGIPIAIATTIGLMGFGWSVEERDNWIVPTIFFGIISFGCSLGSTTSITFALDSYRQYSGEALVTLNFSKNIFHGLVFSLFFPHWLEADGSKKVFIVLGAIQMGALLFTIPIFFYGKRARMWTVKRNLMEKF
ncbi:hypothetical protein EJ08DRAFT_663264 [Tothia fuscella]|uniref:Major facilitator superfamily (MFS) profile domain-containing protein n=1 Tax=Tothia fuscella TaxID=1048955 RepID=A0A9P4NLH2_9PEZI|nr:hypothetical protein EJ08DRAFT_663264 [Tothia fuscella]